MCKNHLGIAPDRLVPVSCVVLNISPVFDPKFGRQAAPSSRRPRGLERPFPPEAGEIFGFLGKKSSSVGRFRAYLFRKLGAEFAKRRANAAKGRAKFGKRRFFGNSFSKKSWRTGSVRSVACKYESVLGVLPKLLGVGFPRRPFGKGAQLSAFNCVRPLRALKFCPNWAKIR